MVEYSVACWASSWGWRSAAAWVVHWALHLAGKMADLTGMSLAVLWAAQMVD